MGILEFMQSLGIDTSKELKIENLILGRTDKCYVADLEEKPQILGNT